MSMEPQQPFDPPPLSPTEQALRAIFRVSPIRTVEVETQLARFEARRDAVGRTTTLRGRPRGTFVGSRNPRVGTPSPWFVSRWGFIAGVLLLAITVSVAWHGRNVITHDSAREYVTRPAQRATWDLPDGTRVVLAPDTRLRYTTEPHGGRAIELRGQAYFTVAPNRDRPLTVRTASSVTHVLGTAFAVRAYDTDQFTQIAVAEGKVSVQATPTSAAVVLLPGDVGRVALKHPPQVTRDEKTGDVFGWMRGRFVFADVPFRDVAVELERIYDLDIRIPDSGLAATRVSIAIDGVPITSVLNALAAASRATVIRQGKIVTFVTRESMSTSVSTSVESDRETSLPRMNR